VDAVGNNNGWITQRKLIWTSWRRVFPNVMKVSRVGSELLAGRTVMLAAIAEVGAIALRTSQRADGAIKQSAMWEQLRINQCVVTPIALSHGCGSIALYTSPYLTPAG
jgi:hypothetical protein